MTLRAIPDPDEKGHLSIVNDAGVEVAVINLFDHGEDKPTNAYTIDVIPAAGRKTQAMMFGFRRDVLHASQNLRHTMEYGEATDGEPVDYGSPVAVIIGPAPTSVEPATLTVAGVNPAPQEGERP